MPLYPPVTALALQAATPVAGYTLVNGTGNIITWTAPNDGQQHRVAVLATLNVSSGETGGLIQVVWKDPSGGSGTQQLYAAGLGTGTRQGATFNLICEAGQAVTIAQNSALTVGAAVLWCEIWGS